MKCNLRTFVSRGFRPAACRRTIIWCASAIFGSGTSSISSTSGEPGARISIAFMLVTPVRRRLRSAFGRRSIQNGRYGDAYVKPWLRKRERRKGIAVRRQRIEAWKSSAWHECWIDDLREVEQRHRGYVCQREAIQH